MKLIEFDFLIRELEDGDLELIQQLLATGMMVKFISNLQDSLELMVMPSKAQESVVQENKLNQVYRELCTLFTSMNYDKGSRFETSECIFRIL